MTCWVVWHLWNSSIHVKHLTSSINELFPTGSSDMELYIQFPLAKDLKMKSVLQKRANSKSNQIFN